MKSFETKIRIRYGETDQMGVVYHGNYSNFLEIGRIEWLRTLGVSYKQMELDGIMLPVISLSLKYKKPACYDDVISVKTILKKMPTATIEFDYEITNEAGEILTLGNTILAFINMKTNRPTRCPKFILDKLQN
ncbi:acyl-CoA thioesterase [Pontimicrobium aquaticum]|uniref:Acyl-CoA thioesterase n=1 Tax=Pontimicrobium aquaticum TaxID=2565367 RepID=A0A4V5LQQ1_9FLAO|nr:thioesterase family protein [Pontimicrobium aquaticum]TJY36099.1 acyl-CoA thioesterase [Pontimicrobium aquaticum]